jgi:hypothetical protein
MEQMTLFIVLGGLLILALVLASIAQRYREILAEISAQSSALSEEPSSP